MNLYNYIALFDLFKSGEHRDNLQIQTLRSPTIPSRTDVYVLNTSHNLMTHQFITNLSLINLSFSHLGYISRSINWIILIGSLSLVVKVGHRFVTTTPENGE